MDDAFPLTSELVLERRDDGVHLVGTAPPRTAFSRELIRTADGRLLCVDGDIVKLALANGTWRYRIVDGDPVTVTAVLIA